MFVPRQCVDRLQKKKDAVHISDTLNTVFLTENAILRRGLRRAVIGVKCQKFAMF